MILAQKAHNSKVRILLYIILLTCLTACGDDISVLNSAYWEKSSNVSAGGGTVSIVISGKPGVTWSAEIIQGDEWCSFNNIDYKLKSISGFISDGDNAINIYCKGNVAAGSRQARIALKFDGEDVQTLTLTQTPSFSQYAETPLLKENDNYQYVTHYTTLNNKTVRNYSLCFDITKRAALWVAYPIHASYFGSTNRTDEWGFDPVIDNYFQADCVTSSYGGPYDRGHQVPSADRLANREMNVQTFYMSNMTPQLNRLNQDMWARLESKVRSYNCSDTLYVVTGAFFENTSLTTTDGLGNRVPLPTHYFKVLLRTVSGSTGKAIAECSDKELKTIGFWVEHKSYGNIDPPRTICTSVADIEAKTGFEFFPQVSDIVKQQNNPAQWGL
ncbi:MAG: DNA/RNA non-specific endonuclease [Paludibacter sp.]|nr:DNA/RNA non-specific endonuclease [Paludibacter sp.]